MWSKNCTSRVFSELRRQGLSNDVEMPKHWVVFRGRAYPAGSEMNEAWFGVA